MVTRRELLKGAALSAGALIRIDAGSVDVAAQEVSATAVRLFFLPRTPAAARHVPDDGALVRQAWPHRTIPPRCATCLEPRGRSRGGSHRPRAIRTQLVQQLRADPKTGTLSFLLGRGPLLGLGEGGPQFDRRGIDRSRCATARAAISCARTAAACRSSGWSAPTAGACIIHRPLGRVRSHRRRRPVHAAGRRCCRSMCSSSRRRDPAVIMRRIRAHHRRTPRCRRCGRSATCSRIARSAGPTKFMWVARTFREKKLPCDALIYLGTEFTPSGWNTRNGEFTWNPRTFPNPKEMHRRAARAALQGGAAHRDRRAAHDRHGRRSVHADKPMPSGRTPDDQWPDDRAVGVLLAVPQAVFDSRRRRLVAGSGRRPRRAVAARAHPHVLGRPAALAAERAAVRAASQRLRRACSATARSSGRATSTRRGRRCKTHVPVAINTGLSGIPFWGTDIGGFVPTAEYTGELHVRWFQFGAFCPLFRAHGRDWHLRLPWGWNTGEVGPIGAARLHRRRGRSRSERAAQRAGRADLSGSTSSCATGCCRTSTRPRASACETGLPMMRALWLHYPDDPQARRRAATSILWGRDILVAPVVEKGATSRRALSAARRVVRLLDRGADRRRPRDRSRASISRRCRCTCGRARSSRWVRSSNTPTSPSTRR